MEHFSVTGGTLRLYSLPESPRTALVIVMSPGGPPPGASPTPTPHLLIFPRPQKRIPFVLLSSFSYLVVSEDRSHQQHFLLLFFLAVVLVVEIFQQIETCSLVYFLPSQEWWVTIEIVPIFKRFELLLVSRVTHATSRFLLHRSSSYCSHLWVLLDKMYNIDTPWMLLMMAFSLSRERR